MDFFYRNIVRIPEPNRVRDRPMQVLALGMSRSGTDSLRLALKRLGYEDTYHGFFILEHQPEDSPFWVHIKAEKLKRGLDAPPMDIPAVEWDRMLRQCMAVTDAPCAVFGQELIKAYPDAKVILNRRDADKWFSSYKSTSFRAADGWLIWLISMFDPIFYYIVRGSRQTVFEYWNGKEFLVHGREMYLRHYKRMESMLEPGSWLDWKVEDGWDPLCKFLGKEVPKEPFPNVNDTEVFEKRIHKVMESYVRTCLRNIGVVAVVLAACTLALWRL